MDSLKSTQNSQCNRETTIKLGQAQIRSEALLIFETRHFIIPNSKRGLTQIRNEAKVAKYETLGKPKA